MTIRVSKHLISRTGKDIWGIMQDVAQRAAAANVKKFPEVLNMGQGFFSYPAPSFVINAAKKAVDVSMVNQYAPSRGRSSMLEVLGEFYSSIYKTQMGSEHALVTTGANEGLLACFMTLVSPGDEVVVFEPFFDQYIYNIELAGGVVKYVPIRPPADRSKTRYSGSDWRIDFEQLRATITDKTRVIVLNTPHNPIGKVFSREELLELGQLCVEKDIYIISDEVYEHLYFTPTFTRIATLSPEIAARTLTVGSAGKSFRVTGWRVGWVVSANAELLKWVHTAHVRICFSSPSPLQEACATSFHHALAGSYFQDMREEYSNKVRIFSAVFEELGLPYTVPEGTYFIVADLSKVKIPADYQLHEDLDKGARDQVIADWLAHTLGVVTIPCSVFYERGSPGMVDTMVRFSLCKEDDFLERAVERLRLLKNYL